MPYFSFPIEDADGVESLFVGSSPSEDDDFVGCCVVVHGAIGSMRGLLSGGDDFFPGFIGGMVGPEIIHVIGV